MLISIILLLVAYVHYNSVKNSESKSTKDLASRLVITAWVFFAIEIVFLVLVISYHHPPNMFLAVAFPIVTFFLTTPHHLGSGMTSGEYVGDRLNYFQPPNKVTGGRAPLKQT
jgi:hypothetical protein